PACGPFDETLPDGACEVRGFAPCPSGFAPDPELATCTEIVSACAPNELPLLGGDCKRVGASACAPGFSPDAEGLGCAPPAAKACEGAEREALSGGCVPLAGCGDAFPPAGATHFVNAAYLDGELDATHFRAIG